MPKKSFEPMKFWPLYVVVFGGISAWAVDAYRLSQAEDRLRHHGEWCQRIEGEVSDVKVECAKLGAK